MFLKTILPKTLIGLGLVILTPGLAMAEDLQSALVSVYNKNPRLLAERARLREVDESYIQARAQGRFTVSGAGSYAKGWIRTPSVNNFFGLPSDGDDTEYGAPKDGAVEIIQPIYQGGRVRAQKQQAKLNVLAAREGLRAQENDIFLTAANAYVDIIRDEEAAQVRRNDVRVLSQQLLAAQDRFEVGIGTRTDIAQSESRLAASEAGLAQAEAQLAISRANYVRVVGRVPAELTPPPQYVLPPSLPDAITAARENNPQLMAAYFNEAAARAGIDVAKAAGRPTISLNGTLARQEDQLAGFTETDLAQLTAQITIPIYSGGLNQSRTRQAQHAKTRLAFETRDTELAIDQQVRQIWAQLEAARAILKTSQRQDAAAKIAFEGVSLEQSVGTRTQLDVLDAEQEALNARLSVLNAQRDVHAATYGLLATIGVFDAEGIQLEVNRYDPNANFDRVSHDALEQINDAYVPEFVQKIAGQVPNIVNEVAAGVQDIGEDSDIDGKLSAVKGGIGYIAAEGKEGIDVLTGQDPIYDPLKGQDRPDIVTEPFDPPSTPPYDPLLDRNADGLNDAPYRPDPDGDLDGDK